MAVPTFTAFFAPELRCLSDGETKRALQIRAQVFDAMNLSEEDRITLLPSGKQHVADNRATWALTYLKKAGLVESPSVGKYRITSLGTAALQDVGDKITLDYLEQFESFREFRLRSAQNTKADITVINESSPQDTMDIAFQQINDDLAANLLQTIMEHSPQFFEKLVVALHAKNGLRQELLRMLGLLRSNRRRRH